MKPCCSVPIHARVRHVVSRALFRYGHAVAKCPWPFIVLPVLVLGELGAGILMIEHNDVFDDITIPRDSQSFKDQAKVRRLFPDHTGDHYDALELNEDQIMGSIIFIARHNSSIYDDDVIQEIRDVIAHIKANVTILMDDVSLRYEDLCGRRHDECVVTGERLLAPQFNAMRKMGILSYPKWKLPTTGDMVDLSFALADSDSELKRVQVVRVTFKLRHDLQPRVFLWEEAFVEFMQTLKTNRTDVVFSASSSVSRELEKSFYADVFFVWLCLGLVALCCFVVTWGGDVVSTRALLVPMGLVSPALGVVAAMGLLSFCQVKVVEMVWVVPLLILGKGMTDMSILMSSWSSRLDREDEDVAQRVGWCVVDVGAAITVSSLSLSIAFCIGYTSSSISVANFCLYAGVAMMFCYISTMMFGVGCLAIHGHRVFSSRHTVTCSVTSSRDHLKKKGKSIFTTILCAGSPAKEKYGDQSVLEKISRFVLLKITGNLIARVVISLLYLGVLAVSIFGIINIKQGVELSALVAQSSYTHDYLITDARYFGFSFPIVFVMDEDVRYSQKMADLMMNLLDKAKQDPGIQDDFVRCWIVDFQKSSSYNLTTEGEDFPGKVVEEFLLKSETFIGDVVLDATGDHIVASRCYVFTQKSSDQGEMTHLMQRMRNLAAAAGFPVFAYHPAFLNYDQRLAVLPSLFKTVGTAMAVLCAVNLAFFPELISSLVTIAGTASIIMGTVGLMNFMHVPVSFVSITHIILNMGFAINVSVHMGAAYLQSKFSARGDRAAEAVASAAAPIFITTLCIMVGVLLFLGAASYSFHVLFKVTVLNLLMVIFHSVFFTPVILSLIGYEKSKEEIDKDQSLKEKIIQQMKLKTSGVTSNGTVMKDEGNEMNVSETLSRMNRGSRGSTAREKWPIHMAASTETNAHVIGNGVPGQRYNREQTGSKPVCVVPKADYEDISVGMCPHGLISSSYENAGKSLSLCGYCNTSSQYENWPNRRITDSKDVHDLSISLPSTRSECRKDVRSSGIMDPHFNYLQPRPLGRRNISSPSSGKRSTGHDGKDPKSQRSNRVKEDIQADIVASFNDMDNVVLESPDYEPVASLEGVHHVACTLSTSGALGATQNYVTENFRDIPH